MGFTIAKLLVSLGLDSSQYTKGMGDAEKKARTSSKAISGGLDSSIKSMMAFGVAGATVGVAMNAAVGFTKEAIKAASDLAETTSKIGVVFGEGSAAVLDFGKNSAIALGMSTNEALAAAGVYGNLFRSMKIGEEVSADMSVNLVKLAADLASFNNIDPSLALDKLRAGLSGEVEPLRTLGVNLNEVIIKQKAMTLGLYDGTGALTAAAKAQASYALIVEQTSLAQGDFARTSEGLANQQRILAAQWKNLKAEVGKGLLPVAIDLVSLTNDAIEGGKRLAYAQGAVNDAMKDNIFLTSSMAVEIYRAAYEEYGLEAAVIAATMATTSQKDMNELTRESTIDLAGASNDLGNELQDVATSAGQAAGNVFNLADANGNLTSSIGQMIDDLKWVNAGGLSIQTFAEEIVAARENYRISAEQAIELLGNLAVVSAQTRVAAGGDIREIAKTLAETLNISIKEANTLLKSTSTSLAAVQGQFYAYLDIYVRTHGSVPRSMVSASSGSVATTEQETMGGEGHGGNKGRASGGFGLGLTTINERGPELVSLPQGSYVHNNAETTRILAGGDGEYKGPSAREIGEAVAVRLMQLGVG